jgi:anti-sigma regulatory factor (Ser/Thr protein kinase)
MARRKVRRTLEARRVPADTIDIIELLTSEVVTNAIVHTGSSPQIELVVSDRQIRVSVEDDSDAMPHLHPGGAAAVTGRGLAMVDELAAVWGSSPVPGGKIVWFEVPFAHH